MVVKYLFLTKNNQAMALGHRSPDAAQVPYTESSGSIQSAGQMPSPVGSLARMSTRPYFRDITFLVLILPEEYWAYRFGSCGNER
ncbi:hypothetical protein [Paenibacillus stellifer]|uniref:hypothetical protein n=1 Tax=Paenibacillus stellifer TaxID=169760 RepID=UPI001FE23D3E|nr:hypothetical protein [Paenibacillus stellifer]